MVKVCFARAVDALLSSQMQRLILIGLAICVVLGGAGIVGIWWMRQNRMDSQWVPFPLHEQSSHCMSKAQASSWLICKSALRSN